mgnify:CR=1 FL=1
MSGTYFRYVRLHDAGDFMTGQHGLFCTVWASGFILRKMDPPHGEWSAHGEFICMRSA